MLRLPYAPGWGANVELKPNDREGEDPMDDDRGEGMWACRLVDGGDDDAAAELAGSARIAANCGSCASESFGVAWLRDRVVLRMV